MAAGPFDHILNWRLLAGSHAFPGPDGGTCINEAAIVAAGLPYRAITRTEDCPPCFSRPLAAYALGLNDAMPDHERRRLLTFVLRLSGSADAPEIESERTAFLALESVRRILPPLLALAGLPALAARCGNAPDAHTAREAALAVERKGCASAYVSACERSWVRASRASAASRTGTAAIKAFSNARCAAEVAEGAAPFVPSIWPVAVAILDEALMIGRQAPEPDLLRVRDRMKTARVEISTVA